MWAKGKLVSKSYHHRLAGGVGVRQSIRLGVRRNLPEMLVQAVSLCHMAHLVCHASVLPRITIFTAHLGS